MARLVGSLDPALSGSGCIDAEIHFSQTNSGRPYSEMLW